MTSRRLVRCDRCGHIHTPSGCTGDPTPSDIWAGVSPAACDCAELLTCSGCGTTYDATDPDVAGRCVHDDFVPSLLERMRPGPFLPRRMPRARRCAVKTVDCLPCGRIEIAYARNQSGTVVHRVDCARMGRSLDWHYASRELGNDHARVMAEIEAVPWLRACSYCMGDPA